MLKVHRILPANSHYDENILNGRNCAITAICSHLRNKVYFSQLVSNRKFVESSQKLCMRHKNYMLSAKSPFITFSID